MLKKSLRQKQKIKKMAVIGAVRGKVRSCKLSTWTWNNWKEPLKVIDREKWKLGSFIEKKKTAVTSAPS